MSVRKNKPMKIVLQQGFDPAQCDAADLALFDAVESVGGQILTLSEVPEEDRPDIRDIIAANPSLVDYTTGNPEKLAREVLGDMIALNRVLLEAGYERFPAQTYETVKQYAERFIALRDSAKSASFVTEWRGGLKQVRLSKPAGHPGSVEHIQFSTFDGEVE